jgi:uncharacterized protein with GYD domain
VTDLPLDGRRPGDRGRPEISGPYTPQAHAAVISAGYVSREAAGRELIESLGGKLQSCYWTASPDRDFVAICDLPSGRVPAPDVLARSMGRP